MIDRENCCPWWTYIILTVLTYYYASVSVYFVHNSIQAQIMQSFVPMLPSTQRVRRLMRLWTLYEERVIQVLTSRVLKKKPHTHLHIQSHMNAHVHTTTNWNTQINFNSSTIFLYIVTQTHTHTYTRTYTITRKHNNCLNICYFTLFWKCSNTRDLEFGQFHDFILLFNFALFLILFICNPIISNCKIQYGG